MDCCLFLHDGVHVCLAMRQPAANAQVRDGLFNISRKMVGEDGAAEAMLQLEAFWRKVGCFGSQCVLTMIQQNASIPMVGRPRLQGGGWGAEKLWPSR